MKSSCTLSTREWCWKHSQKKCRAPAQCLWCARADLFSPSHPRGQYSDQSPIHAVSLHAHCHSGFHGHFRTQNTTISHFSKQDIFPQMLAAFPCGSRWAFVPYSIENGSHFVARKPWTCKAHPAFWMHWQQRCRRQQLETLWGRDHEQSTTSNVYVGFCFTLVIWPKKIGAKTFWFALVQS